MARRRHVRSTGSPIAIDRKLVFLGDVRQVPVEIREGGRVFYPDIALLVRADDGRVVGQAMAPPGGRAEVLVQALFQPVPMPGETGRAALPGQLVLFSQPLAAEVRQALAQRGINVDVRVAPIEEQFEEIFAALFAHLQDTQNRRATITLPDEALKPLVAAAERLWRTKPWTYAYDNPPFSVVPRRAGSKPLYRSILGANRQMFGVVLYSSIEDYDNTLKLGVLNVTPALSAEEEATALLRIIQQRTFLVTFEAKDELLPAYRDQVIRCGWSRRLSVVPEFGGTGGGQEPGVLTTDEAAIVALAVEALVTFCERHRTQISREEFPIRDSIEVGPGIPTTLVDVAVPPDKE